jgi:hypothetical protein
MAGASSGNDAHHPERVLDRRGFVKLAGTAGAGLTLGPAARGVRQQLELGWRLDQDRLRQPGDRPARRLRRGRQVRHRRAREAVRRRREDGRRHAQDRGPDPRQPVELQPRGERHQRPDPQRQRQPRPRRGHAGQHQPVADASCEANGTPCISSVAPWQSYFFGRKGTPDKPFKWTYHFFWGLEDLIGVYSEIWPGVPTNTKIGRPVAQRPRRPRLRGVGPAGHLGMDRPALRREPLPAAPTLPGGADPPR